MIAKIFINSAPLLVEPSEQGGAPRLALGSQPYNDNFVGTIYFGHWFKGDKGDKGEPGGTVVHMVADEKTAIAMSATDPRGLYVWE